ncbi:MAG TPA: hypothetical protein VN657_14415 [Nitrospiraceae bacterium]|jgi:hypothetical protein|nr:hypothetical protein [Nitrospiraceae bacterium]
MKKKVEVAVEPSLVDKLPIYMVAWSLPPAFVILAVVVSALDSFNEAGVAVIKGEYMFLLVVGGTLLNLWLYAQRQFKLKRKFSPLHIIASLLLPLAYVCFYYGATTVLVLGICLVGILLSVLSARQSIDMV